MLTTEQDMNDQIASRRRRMSGFTLLEIMVVVVIIGLLAAMLAPIVVDRLDEATVTRVKTDIRTIETALKQFRIDNYRYPNDEEGLGILLGGRRGVNDDNYRRYLEQAPIDPWGNDYLYEPDSEHDKDYDIFSLGADGKEGGDGIDADIGNWNLN
jgi:general secretion pathway protein G